MRGTYLERKNNKKNKKNKKEVKEEGLIDLVFSWSLTDVMNKDLYRNQVQRIPETFSSTEHYFRSFIDPLIEETHSDLLDKFTTVYQAPVCEIIAVEEHKDFKLPENLLYEISINRQRPDREKDYEVYQPEGCDLIALTEVRPKCIDDLDRPGRRYTIALVKFIPPEDDEEVNIRILSSNPITFEDRKTVKLFAVHLTNLTTNLRIWNALRGKGNMNIVRSVLKVDSTKEVKCKHCFDDETKGTHLSRLREVIGTFGMDDSQETAILNCIITRACSHQNSVELIWGPPGTGKTKTIASLLFALLKMNCRTVTCAPTNIAVLGVAKRLQSMLSGRLSYSTYGLGDVVLIGNEKRMNIFDDHEDLYEVFLDYRIDVLLKCFAPQVGWEGHVLSMINLLEDPKGNYQKYLVEKEKQGKGHGGNCDSDNDDDTEEDENGDIIETLRKKYVKEIAQKIHKKKSKRQEHSQKGSQLKFDKRKLKNKKTEGRAKRKDATPWTFEMFIKKKFNSIGRRLMIFTSSLYTHLPTSYLKLEVVKDMDRILDMIKTIKSLIQKALVGKNDLRLVLEGKGVTGRNFNDLYKIRFECLRILKSFRDKFPVPKLCSELEIRNFCLGHACLIFCTAASSDKVRGGDMRPIELLIIDEAAQLKECESTIPLQLPGVRHAILVGDEKQLPAMVQSKICERADFGRSLFERLVRLGHNKHLLNVQYRMHPSISLFPNKKFYGEKIRDGPNVRETAYERRFLKGNAFGSYSFIDMTSGKEEFDEKHSLKNTVEVSAVAGIVSNLYKECVASKQKVRVGCLSPYKAQVFAIQQILGKKYSSDAEEQFSVTVRSVDGFQGGEEDVIIFSTVRNNGSGSVGFLSNCQRANVALTRARYCLWILGNSATLLKSSSVWKKLVLDSKNRGFFHNAFDDKDMAQAITQALLEHGHFSLLFNTNSIAFRNLRWKICFSDEFLRSMSKIQDINVRKEVLSLLEKISSGWRLQLKNKVLNKLEGACSELLEIYDVTPLLKLIWTVDIVHENGDDIQVIKILDILPTSKISSLVKKLDAVFGNYTVNYMRRCLCKHIEGNMVLPISWPSNTSTTNTRPDNDVTEKLVSTLAAVSLRGESGTSMRSWRVGRRAHLSNAININSFV